MAFRRAALISTALASTAVVLGLALAALAVDVGRVAALRAELNDAAADAAVIEAQRVHQLRANEASGRVTARVAAGELSLATAVDELEPLLRDRTGFAHDSVYGPCPTFRHRVGRYVVTRVAADLEGESGRRATVLVRLDAEYATLR